MVSFKEYLSELNKPGEIKTFKDRTSDVKAIDSRDLAWQGTLTDLFGKYGFHKVGSGKYGTVFINPKYSYAVKVFMKDTAYLKYIQFALKNQRNPYVPKIRGKVVKINDMFMAIRIERLKEYDVSHRACKEFVDMCLDPEDFLEGYSSFITIHPDDKNAQDICKFLVQNRNLTDIHGGNIMMRNNQPVLIDPLYNWFKGGSLTIDPDDLSNLKDIF